MSQQGPDLASFLGISSTIILATRRKLRGENTPSISACGSCTNFSLLRPHSCRSRHLKSASPLLHMFLLSRLDDTCWKRGHVCGMCRSRWVFCRGRLWCKLVVVVCKWVALCSTWVLCIQSEVKGRTMELVSVSLR